MKAIGKLLSSKSCECRSSFVGKKTGKEVKFYCIMIQLA